MTRKPNGTGRSKGEARHVRLYHWLMATAAWRSLDPVARAAYVDLAALYNGTNNGKIARSVRDAAAALNVGPVTAMRAHRRLEAVGLIVRETRGAFSRKVRHAAEWRLTEFNSDVTGELASKDFARWTPDSGAQVIVAKHQNREHGARSETDCYRGETPGTCGETPSGKKGRLGARGETWNPQNTPFSGYRGETHIVYQGKTVATAPAEGERSAPPHGAVASSPVVVDLKNRLSSISPNGRSAA